MEKLITPSSCHYVGKPARRADGIDFVLGRAKFVGDMRVPGMLVAKVLRSPLPHARITHLNVAPALKVPGVVAAITSQDFIEHGQFGWPISDAYILAYQKVRYVGDPIAVVAAETETAARAGVQAIRLELEELPGVFDMKEALAPGAALVPLESVTGEGNLLNTHLVRNGDPDPILAQCPVVLDETYRMGHQEHAYLETEGALALPDGDGGVTVYANNQSPFINRRYLMRVLGLPEAKVRVIQPPVGGSFGGKDDIGYQNSGQVAALALKTGRPVRLVLTREESFLASYKREAMQIRLVLGADEGGCLHVARAELLADSGGYSSQTLLASWRATVHAAGAYRYEAVHVDTRVVYTNNGYSGAFRGFGNTEAVAAIEQAVDELAYRCGQDPIAFRLRNALRQGDRCMTGNRIDHAVVLTDCLEWVRDHSGWAAKRAEYSRQDPGATVRRGIGVACYMHGSSLGGEGADYAITTLAIEPDDSIVLTSGLTDYGQGSRTVFQVIAAETLGVKPERIHILRPDTQTALESGPTVASRSTMVGGNATRAAAAKLDRLLLWAAADLTGSTSAQIVRDGENYIGPSEVPRDFHSVVDHARQMGIMLSVQGRWQMPLFEWDFEKGEGIPYHCYVFGAQVAEVQVDVHTGETRVLGMWAAHDGGKIIFPEGAAGQMYGGIAQGIGYCLLEEMKYDHGYPQAISYDGYLIPTAIDVPQIQGTFIETAYPEGPFGAKNLAEPMMVATAPSIANALYQATGRRMRSLPITLEQIVLGRDLQVPGSKQRCQEALTLAGSVLKRP
ncbi:MAG TPA: xanthine dehydrogenase family protein molybdopterin-binding subunit [Anaerolineaceae bacterium]|nr:xanthine dehydrogenase family protein molybdopterin-binding subunit [Anaerolineaceae bacterium]